MQDGQPNAQTQLDHMKSSLFDSLMRKQRLQSELAACDKQIDALTNYLAGADVGRTALLEQIQAEADRKKAEAASKE